MESSQFNLKYVFARHNNFKDEAAKAIADGIKISYSQLIKLDLSSNSINDAGGELIAEAIKSNTCLVSLNLARNNMRASSGEVFKTSMEQNDKITYLNLNENCITINFINEVNNYLKRNLMKFKAT